MWSDSRDLISLMSSQIMYLPFLLSPLQDGHSRGPPNPFSLMLPKRKMDSEIYSAGAQADVELEIIC